MLDENYNIVFDNPMEEPHVGCNRTPRDMKREVALLTDSGIYITYAIECDYFDAPIFAEPQDWVHFRNRLAYCILKKEFLL